MTSRVAPTPKPPPSDAPRTSAAFRTGRKGSQSLKPSSNQGTQPQSHSRSTSKAKIDSGDNDANFWDDSETSHNNSNQYESLKPATRDSLWKRPEFNMSPGPTTFSSRAKKTLFSTQQVAPAPGTTYYQLVVQEKDSILLRDWPKQRMSQKWTRDGALNPGQVEITYSEFLDGELKEQLLWIFGEDVVE
ncbi:hypothetical protein HK096_008048, partial [Nowakowskiella sp. JEL0078]